ncbi:hypothetical protein [Actinoplanes sp. HUAS TT8]|uniref:hypothetical protein n=1 Tax=Actinoplanes sp. HUAS TT8 TaxID=3447453 RepID=UPI003F526CCD
MQIEVVDISPGRPHPIARFVSRIGQAAVPWCGNPDAPPGKYYIEWTIEPDLVWGVNTTPADEPGPAIRTDGDHVILRGRLDVRAATLQVDDALILIGGDHTLPREADGTWIQIRVPVGDAHLYPYQI